MEKYQAIFLNVKVNVAKTLIKLLGITFVFCDEAHVCLVLPGHCGSLILEKFVPSYNNSSSMHLYSIKVCYLVTVFCMLVIITPDLRLCNSDVYSCRYVIFRKYPTIDVWCVCACVRVLACASSGAVVPYSTEQ